MSDYFETPHNQMVGGPAATSSSSVDIQDPVIPEHRPSDDIVTAVSSEIAEMLAQKFYPALSATRETISTFYVPAHTKDGRQFPQISFNGNVYHSGEEFERMVKEIEPLTFDIETLDCAPINTVYSPGVEPGVAAKKAKHMSVIVTIGGAVKVGDPIDDDERGFSDNYVVVPNPDFQGQKRRGKAAKEWLIQTHNFRFVS